MNVAVQRGSVLGNALRIAAILLVALLGVLGCLSLLCGSRDTTPPKLGDPIAGLSKKQRQEFEAGRRIFERVFTPDSGLGPLFNADACAECHEEPVVGGVGDEIEIHATIPIADPACDLLETRGGPVFQQQVTQALQNALGIDREPIPPDAFQAMRTTPDLFGFGLLDAVSDSTLLAYEDPNDANGDGISGRVNRSPDGHVGRFGRKALIAHLAEFNAGAFQIEQGITNPGAPDEGTVGGVPLPPGVDPTVDPELDAESVRLASEFVRFLAPPAPLPRNYDAQRGAQLFGEIGCASCHLPTLRTGASDVAALAYRKVDAYTDLLLHDMGPTLADICFGDAMPSEFRTEPLMGLRFVTQFLHDGRAKTVEEAIDLHGGEAASSRSAFLALNERDRAAILTFLKGL